MIIRFDTFINEGLIDKMKGKNKEEIWKSLGFDRIFDDPTEFYDLFLKFYSYLLMTIFLYPQQFEDY